MMSSNGIPNTWCTRAYCSNRLTSARFRSSNLTYLINWISFKFKKLNFSSVRHRIQPPPRNWKRIIQNPKPLNREINNLVMEECSWWGRTDMAREKWWGVGSHSDMSTTHLFTPFSSSISSFTRLITYVLICIYHLNVRIFFWLKILVNFSIDKSEQINIAQFVY